MTTIHGWESIDKERKYQKYLLGVSLTGAKNIVSKAQVEFYKIVVNSLHSVSRQVLLAHADPADLLSVNIGEAFKHRVVQISPAWHADELFHVVIALDSSSAPAEDLDLFSLDPDAARSICEIVSFASLEALAPLLNDAGCYNLRVVL